MQAHAAIERLESDNAELHRNGMSCFFVTGKTCRPDGANGFLPRFAINMPRLRRSVLIGINANRDQTGSPEGRVRQDA